MFKTLKRHVKHLRPSAAADPAAAGLKPEWIQHCAYWAESVCPPPSEAGDLFVPSHEVGHAGIDLHADEQLALLDRWKSPEHAALFAALREDPNINTGYDGRGYPDTTCLHNGWYPTPDAEIYAAMIFDRRPSLVVEVGSGFSTCVARKAIEFAGLSTRLEVIDPAPRRDVAEAADKVTYSPVEKTDLLDYQFADDAILFIDSSHVSRARGDVPFLYGRVLPSLPRGVRVHVHDIFLPYDYPTNYDALCWTEQYVLQGLLSHSPRYRTRLASQFLSRRHKGAMQAVFGPHAGDDPYLFGASYWFDVVDG